MKNRVWLFTILILFVSASVLFARIGSGSIVDSAEISDLQKYGGNTFLTRVDLTEKDMKGVGEKLSENIFSDTPLLVKKNVDSEAKKKAAAEKKAEVKKKKAEAKKKEKKKIKSDAENDSESDEETEESSKRPKRLM